MRLGPKQQWALQLIADNPGCSKLYIARRIAPHGTGIQYGYRVVNRLIRRGLLTATFSRGKYALRLKEDQQ